MKKQWSILAAILCAALTFGGCNKETLNDGETNTTTINKTDPAANEKQMNLDVLQPLAYGNVNGLNLEPGTNISIIGRSNDSAYWKEVEAGARRAVADMNKALGYKGDDKIKLNYSAPQTENDVDDQSNILDEELARYPSALGIAAVDAAACQVQFDLAAENNIPIVAFDSGVDYQDVVSMVDTNNQMAASTAASKLSDSIEDTGEVALFVHDSKSTSAKEREEGFIKEITANHPDVKIVKIYHLDELEELKKEMIPPTTEGDDTAPAEPSADTQDITQAQAVQYILEKNPNLKGAFASNENCAKLLLEACENLKKEDLKIVSFDGGTDQLKLLKDGKLEGLIVQNPYGIGYATVVACARAILQQGNEALVDSGYTWVTDNNFKNESIQKMMY